MRSWYLGAVVLILAGTATFFAVRHLRPTESDAIAPVDGDGTPAHAAIVRPLTIPDRLPISPSAGPDSEGQGSAMQTDGPATAPDGESEPTDRPRIPNEVFDEKYRGETRDELVVTRVHVEDEFFALQSAAAEDCLARGNFETEIRERPPTDDIVFPPAKPMGGLAHGRKTNVLPDGKLETKTYVLSWEDYGEMYAKSDELAWLNRKIEKLNQSIRFAGQSPN